jgi:hypothetical protein
VYVPVSVTHAASVTLVFCAMGSKTFAAPTGVRCMVTRIVVGASPATSRIEVVTR